jgi:hypothetical protein
MDSIGGVNKAELRAMLSSGGVGADMLEYAEGMASRARSAAPDVGDRDGGPLEGALPVEADMRSGSFGARAIVTVMHPAGLNVEAKHALLAGSQ